MEALRPSTAEIEYRKVRRFSFWLGLVLAVLSLIGLLSGVPAIMGPGSLALLFGLVLLAPALINPLANFFGYITALLFARDGTGELAEGNLKRQPTRAAITAGTTMIGLAIIVTAASMVSSMAGSMMDMVKKTLGSDYLLIPPSIAIWNSSVGADNNLTSELTTVPGMGPISTLRYANSATETVVSGAIKKPGMTASDGNGTVAISMMGIDPQTFPQVSGLRFITGNDSAYAALASGRNMVVNGTFVAQTGAKLGDTLQLVTLQGKQPYKIVAIATDYLNVKITTAFISQANLQADFNTTEDRFIQFNLAKDANRTAADAQIKQIVSAYPQFRLVEGEKYYQETVKLMNSMFIGIYAIMALLTVPSVIAMLNTLAIGVIERTREIGLLRAIGATRVQVRKIVLIEAILLAAIGTAFGIIGGLYLGRVLVAILAGFFPIVYMFPVQGILTGIAIGLIFGVLAAIIPARQAARMQIVEALRYE
jgi:putative ABC transport system permease protein